MTAADIIARLTKSGKQSICVKAKGTYVWAFNGPLHGMPISWRMGPRDQLKTCSIQQVEKVLL